MLDEKIKECRDILKDISRLENTLINNNVKVLIENIVDTSVKITRTAEEDDLHNLRNFFAYYLPQTLKILKAYKSACDSGIESIATENFKKESIEILTTISKALDNLLDTLLKSDYNSLRAEMKVLENEFKTSGLVNNDDFIL